MGNWQLEVAKMALYVFVPVGAFYFYHQVDYFEEELARFARKSHTKYTLEQGKMIREAIEVRGWGGLDSLRETFDTPVRFERPLLVCSSTESRGRPSTRSSWTSTNSNSRTVSPSEQLHS